MIECTCRDRSQWCDACLAAIQSGLVPVLPTVLFGLIGAAVRSVRESNPISAYMLGVPPSPDTRLRKGDIIRFNIMATNALSPVRLLVCGVAADDVTKWPMPATDTHDEWRALNEG